MTYLDQLVQDSQFVVPNADEAKRDRPRLEVGAEPICAALTELFQAAGLTNSFNTYVATEIRTSIGTTAVEQLAQKLLIKKSLDDLPEKDKGKIFAGVDATVVPLLSVLAKKIANQEITKSDCATVKSSCSAPGSCTAAACVSVKSFLA